MEKGNSEDHWRWGKTVVSSLDRIRAESSTAVPIADFEVIPPFDGSPDGIFVWFIVDKASDVPTFRESCLSTATRRLHQELGKTDFPSTAFSTIGFDVTSLEDIEIGGGRFAYFR